LKELVGLYPPFTTALTTLSQRWNTLSWLAEVVVVVKLAAVVVLAAFYRLLDMQSLLGHLLQLQLALEA